MITIYFISGEDKCASTEVSSFFSDKKIEVAYASPDPEAIGRIKPFTDSIHQPIYLVDELAERKVGNLSVDSIAFEIEQWENFEGKMPDGESLYEVQERMIDTLQMIVNKEAGKNVLVSSHSVAVATLINFFDESFAYRDYVRIRQMNPYIVKFEFDGEICVGIEEIIGVGK